MAERPEVRIGTAEREEAVELLGEHFAAGRLSLSEFDERVALAMQATIRADLVPLFADLPTAPAVVSSEPRNVAEELLTLVPFVIVALLAIAVVRHPVVILVALGALYFVGRRAYRLITEERGSR
ncbi:DUF1707 domain-containing protein [Rhodococcus sp. Z13]|uniref:DUF1707 domain-containing protein n=1 Tax=Rhodococcus sacchari TaxID=2962047 RepID=A0ACD4DD17_9NOCA|nr:DUF1707 domain-containing protein [Rhodococcus sp. Z13]UYP17866.1 DUF1707 domain-containing protein [Rhodococcus sp. Z13]